MSPWQPIETAPKDGTEFVAYCEDDEYWLIRWCPNDKEDAVKWAGRGAWCAGKDVGEQVVVSCLTHWQPLPDPPQAVTP
jgi:hypothetical protein